MARDYEALLIAGRSGVGKSSVGWEVSAQLQAARVAHCLVEGDLLDAAYPPPPGDPHKARMTEDNLAALWRNYADRGYRRLIYTNTVSVLESELIRRALGGTVHLTGVLLGASDETAQERLAIREIGSEFDVHIERSNARARQLEWDAPDWVARIPTDGRAVASIARDVIAATGWLRAR